MLEDGNYTRLVAPSSSPLTLLFSGNDGISTQACGPPRTPPMW